MDSAGVEFLNMVFVEAVRQGVADIHFLAQNGSCFVRFRMPGGDMSLFREADMHLAVIIEEKIRSKAQLSTSDKKSPLDGRMSLYVDQRAIDVRVAITPSVSCGYLIVCRLLDQANANIKITNIKMTKTCLDGFLTIKEEKRGLFIVTGPTGSGKTTTLYSLINSMNDGSLNIVTLEDPVEYRVKGLHQIEVDINHLSFPQGLRAILRQDPDIILVGEIRDAETAAIAIEAAITGHLVLTTMHAGTVDEAITRLLLTFKTNPLTLAAALKGVVAQRLLKTIQANNGVIDREPANDFHRAWLTSNNIEPSPEGYPVITNNTVKKGVMPIMEMVITDSRIKKALCDGGENVLNAAVLQPQYESLSDAGERAARAGLVTMDEVCKTITMLDSQKPTSKKMISLLVDWGKLTKDEAFNFYEELAVLKMEGVYHKPCAYLVKKEICDAVSVKKAIGFSYQGAELISHLNLSESGFEKCRGFIKNWIPGQTSVFDFLLNEGLCSEEDIDEQLFS